MSDLAPGLIPAKVCAYCGEPFTPLRPTQQYCSSKVRPCKFKAHGRRLRGVVPAAAIAGKKARDQRIIDQRVADRFGVLSEREQAIYVWAESRGYDRGYQVAYSEQYQRRRA